MIRHSHPPREIRSNRRNSLILHGLARTFGMVCFVFLLATGVEFAAAQPGAVAPPPVTPLAGDLVIPAPADEAEGPAIPNLPTLTLGGKLFWTDLRVRAGWRIQQSSITGHCRLLDNENYRHAYGTLEHCEKQLRGIIAEKAIPAPEGEVVVTLHGLMRSRDVMQGLGDFLESEGQLTPVHVSYASTRRSLDDHATSLARVIDNLGSDVTKIHFVGHSLGNLVIRRYYGEASAAEPRWKVDPRVGRVVMLAPPNQGAHAARIWRDNDLFELVTGPSGKQLGLEWKQVEPRLGRPSGEFGIIAGAHPGGPLGNPLLPGDDDLVLSVSETVLPGASDSITVPLHHGEIISNAEVKAYVLQFLQNGYFVASDKRQPIPLVEDADEPSSSAEVVMSPGENASGK